MAVYTVLEREDIEALIEPYGIGPLVDFEGVAAGIENTTYFLTTDQSDFPSETRTEPLQSFVLTLFESADPAALAFYVQFTTTLNLRGLPVPAPLTDSDGNALTRHSGKPVALLPRAPGSHPETPSPTQCREIGAALAAIHRVALESGAEHPPQRGLAWLQSAAGRLKDTLDDQGRELLAEVPRFAQQLEAHPELPRAVIHGDLFRDNALFEGERLSAIIDFFSAGTGYLLYDLAVVANDWCSTADGSLDPQRTEALLSAYQAQRPVGEAEKRLWNDFLRIAATRFWLSRLIDQNEPADPRRPGALVETKDPAEYRNILVQRIHTPQNWL